MFQQQSSLFENKNAPLADQLRPKQLSDYIGQSHIINDRSQIAVAIKNNKPFPMLLWGPPGCGKTTLALLLAKEFHIQFIRLSAVFSGVKEVRQAIDQAKKDKQMGKQTILFIDEIHRFNKAQQDAFLPYVEDGTIILIGATTENPAFNVNSALLSRLHTYHLKKLTQEDILKALDRGLSYLNHANLQTSEALEILAYQADGDARRALGWLEEWVSLVDAGIDQSSAVEKVLADIPKAMDKQGDWFYELLSAFHKSLRGSNPDAAMYWFARMVDSGADPLIICRRMLCVASEDIGNADPQALSIALNAYQTFERLGAPEGYLAIAQCITYLAVAPKSNASYMAMNRAFQYVKNNPSHEVPKHLRNAPTALHEKEGYKLNYRYSHDEPYAYSAGQGYLPDEMKNIQFYQPNDRGFEKKMLKKLKILKDLDLQWQS